MLHILVHNKHWLIILKRINIVCVWQSWHLQNDKTAPNPIKTVFSINENKDIFIPSGKNITMLRRQFTLEQKY